MDNCRQYLFSIIACSLCCAIVSQLLSDTKRKELIHLICGVVMAIVIIRPLTGLDLAEIFRIPLQNRDDADFCIVDGKNAASQALEERIKASCEAYILDKAKALGADIRATVLLNEEMLPVFAEISGEPAPAIEKQLQDILMMDLGIPKENQKWIWNPESSS